MDRCGFYRAAARAPAVGAPRWRRKRHGLPRRRQFKALDAWQSSASALYYGRTTMRTRSRHEFSFQRPIDAARVEAAAQEHACQKTQEGQVETQPHVAAAAPRRRPLQRPPAIAKWPAAAPPPSSPRSSLRWTSPLTAGHRRPWTRPCRYEEGDLPGGALGIRAAAKRGCEAEAEAVGSVARQIVGGLTAPAAWKPRPENASWRRSLDQNPRPMLCGARWLRLAPRGFRRKSPSRGGARRRPRGVHTRRCLTPSSCGKAEAQTTSKHDANCASNGPASRPLARRAAGHAGRRGDGRRGGGRREEAGLEAAARKPEPPRGWRPRRQGARRIKADAGAASSAGRHGAAPLVAAASGAGAGRPIGRRRELRRPPTSGVLWLAGGA